MMHNAGYGVQRMGQIIMDREKIITALKKAKRGIEQYLEIMDSFHSTDVSTDRAFQRRFNSFYRIRQRTEIWYKTYYPLMEQQKGKAPSFPLVLRYLHSELGRYEPSFSSKLVATHNPNLPIWDRFVLNHIGIKQPAYSDPKRYYKAEDTYKEIQNWYERFLISDSGNLIADVFDEFIFEHNRISKLKKIDFVLWQSRA